MKSLHALAFGLLLAGSVPSFAIDIPPTVVLSGGTDVNDYTLTANGQVQGNGTFSGTFNTQTHDLSVNTLTGNLIFNGIISGTATSPLPNLTVTAGNHTVELNAANSFTGDVLLQSGTIKLGNAAALGSGSGSFRTTLGAAILDLNGQTVTSETAGINASTTFRNSSASPASWGGEIDISGANLTFNTTAGDINVSGAISGGGVIKTGAGTLFVSGNNSGLTAAWDLVGGKLKFGSSTAAGLGVAIATAGTEVDLAGQTIAGATIQSGSNSFILSNSEAATATWNGTISTAGTTVVTFETVGNLVIAGAITQASGTTSISVEGTGTTRLASAGNTFTGNVTVAAGSTLELADGGRLNFVIGADGINNQIGGAGSVSLDGDFAFNLTGAGTNVGDSWIIVDTASLSGFAFTGNFTVDGFTLLGGGNWQRNHFGTTYQFSQTTGELSVIPEPSPVALATLGGLLLFFALRRRATA